ncbi:hypothetical protein [Streptomyces sp. NPDC088246]|uniref:hypothetical protein n=1 Tax=Streptomyces sp. NPDC088246 TaxID=3365842 RepID=UPI00380C2BEF
MTVEPFLLGQVPAHDGGDALRPVASGDEAAAVRAVDDARGGVGGGVPNTWIFTSNWSVQK